MSELKYDICITFDMTCSMSPCIFQVKQELDRFLDNITKRISNIRIGIITHGDYDSTKYVTRYMNFTSDISGIRNYIQNVENAGSNGWNNGEAYEEVLYVAKTEFTWDTLAKKILIVIGDDIPHIPMFPGNTKKLDWRKELQSLNEMGVSTYGIQAPTLSRDRSNFFYSELSKHSLNGQIIPLNQFIYIIDILLALIYTEHSNEMAETFETELINNNKYNRNMEIVFNNLLNRTDENNMVQGGSSSNTTSNIALENVSSSRFQILSVQNDISIKDFVILSGIVFKTGRGFYELSKTEKISYKKDIVLQHITSGEFYSGKSAKKMLSLPDIGKKTTRLSDVPTGYLAFIQSTSYNRKLKANTKFLYDIS